MSREIKFRGLSFDKGWIYGNLIKSDQSTWIRESDYYNFKVKVDTVGQFTGLHDKNGKEIYEGDILRIIVNNNIEKICAVEFKSGIFGVMFSKQRELTAFPHFCNTTFEVIGNVFENPELLGGE